MQTKNFDASIKAVGGSGGLSAGQFTALVAVFGNVDHGGDVIVPGAFKDSLAQWEESGAPIPVIWSHQWADPMAHIGHVLAAEETADGLLITAQLDLDNPTGAQVFKLLDQKRVKEFSFGYDVREAGPVTVNGQDAFELRQLDLIEAGPTLRGMNPETQLLGTKSDDEIRRIVREEIAADKVVEDTTGTAELEAPPDPIETSGTPPESSPPQGGEPSGPSKSAGLSHAQVAAWATAAELILMEER
ncbi:HK97 family phage prohead protease [Curtobacterium sp. 'Ferrero']|uniref:HK97 family phage prohead protease n=1 Tax=Curtobacterium sp. 'Ferrero' TaxID=2033654 RepID=UPI001596A283|nr:HK97 family phage prohead protease [Curtobacterium sp. 'Ferrero']